VRNWFLGTAFAVLAAAEISLTPVLVTSDGAGPDLVLLLSVFVALRAPWGVHPFFHLGLGTFSDLFAVPRPGLRGFTYMLVALAIERLNPGYRRRNPLVLGALAALAGLCVEMVYVAVAAAYRWPAGPHAAVAVGLKSALLTGLAGLLLCWPANLAARAFGWPAAAAPLSWRQMMAAAAAGTARSPRRRKS
jgi:hypothetical protein